MRIEMLNLVYVGVGGLIGSIGRYLVAGAVYQIFPNSYFPIGTTFVNILGCFLIGFISGLVEVRNLLSPEMRIFLLIGLLGGFTTFSTFSFETVALLRDGIFLTALANVLIQVVIGISAVWLGFNVIRYI
jgi:fluoride exporter